MIHVYFSLSPIPVPLRRVVHALQQQKIAPFMYGLLSRRSGWMIIKR